MDKTRSSLFGVIGPYKGLVFVMVILAVLANGLYLFLPKIIAVGIDSYSAGTLDLTVTIWQFSGVVVAILIFAYLQSIAQTYTSERAARDMRGDIIARISQESYSDIQRVGASRFLTNLTSDIDNVKLFISAAVVNIISSIFLIIGVTILLVSINWRLGLTVMLILSFISVTFFVVFSRLRPLFTKTQEVIDRLNRTINESVLGASIVRVLNSGRLEYKKFLRNNTEAKDLGILQLRLFSGLIPVVTLISNLAVLAILFVGGRFVILGSMTLGNFTAFMTYLLIVFFPIIIIGFMSNVISRASVSYERIQQVLDRPKIVDTGTIRAKLRGDIELQGVCLSLDGRPVLKNVSFKVPAGSRTAIIGPTAAGKTQLLYLLNDLLKPDSGHILYDGRPISEYEKESFHHQVGLVFQDSIMFNMSLRENITFSKTVGVGEKGTSKGTPKGSSSDISDPLDKNVSLNKTSPLDKAVKTAELEDYVASLPKGLETQVSERGTSLSGGQKQRIMLARALSLEPRVLFLDDFTARVDTVTEKKILDNISGNYADLTLVSVTQKISSIEHFDQIILLMEGDVLAIGRHEELIKSSPEYVQIYNSQHSTTSYEQGGVQGGGIK